VGIITTSPKFGKVATPGDKSASQVEQLSRQASLSTAATRPLSGAFSLFTRAGSSVGGFMEPSSGKDLAVTPQGDDDDDDAGIITASPKLGKVAMPGDESASRAGQPSSPTARPVSGAFSLFSRSASSGALAVMPEAEQGGKALGASSLEVKATQGLPPVGRQWSLSRQASLSSSATRPLSGTFSLFSRAGSSVGGGGVKLSSGKDMAVTPQDDDDDDDAGIIITALPKIGKLAMLGDDSTSLPIALEGLPPRPGGGANQGLPSGGQNPSLSRQASLSSSAAGPRSGVFSLVTRAGSSVGQGGSLRVVPEPDDGHMGPGNGTQPGSPRPFAGLSKRVGTKETADPAHAKEDLS
jgi:hypothetical protein